MDDSGHIPMEPGVNPYHIIYFTQQFGNLDHYLTKLDYYTDKFQRVFDTNGQGSDTNGQGPQNIYLFQIYNKFKKTFHKIKKRIGYMIFQYNVFFSKKPACLQPQLTDAVVHFHAQADEDAHAHADSHAQAMFPSTPTYDDEDVVVHSHAQADEDAHADSHAHAIFSSTPTYDVDDAVSGASAVESQLPCEDQQLMDHPDDDDSAQGQLTTTEEDADADADADADDVIYVPPKRKVVHDLEEHNEEQGEDLLVFNELPRATQQRKRARIRFM